MKKISFLFFIFISTKLQSQELSVLEKVPVPAIIDTLFIDHDINNWSLRVYTSYKDHRFKLKNDNNDVAYAPSNRYGTGIGFATRKLVLDIGFNIKGLGKEPTERFDMQFSYMLSNHYFDVFLQAYKGFNLKNNIELNNKFRRDIHSFSSGINYMYLFNAEEYSVGALKTGLAKQKKPAVSFGVGGFIFTNRMIADSSIIPSQLSPNFNEEAEIIELRGLGSGVLSGFSFTTPLLEDFIFSTSVIVGTGLMHKEVKTEDHYYVPANPIVYQLDLSGIIGYNSVRYYVNFSIGMAFFDTSLDFGNRALYNTTKAKLVFGYKLRSK